MKNILTILKEIFDNMEIPYTFDEWDNDLKLPQFIGEILETPTLDEDGRNEYSFILTGYDAESYSYLFDISNKLKSEFKNWKIVKGVVIKYDDTSTIKVENEDLKQIQINLKIKEWSVK